MRALFPVPGIMESALGDDQCRARDMTRIYQRWRMPTVRPEPPAKTLVVHRAVPGFPVRTRRSADPSTPLLKLGSIAILSLLLAACTTSNGLSQAIDAARGADPRIDYAALSEIGPWDDRNYQLTKEDLQLLADNEAELTEPLPVFFRVLIRRENPSLPSTGPAQYPRSALQIFLQRCGGYLIDGRYYRQATFSDGRFDVVTDSDGVPASKTPECQLRIDDGDK